MPGCIKRNTEYEEKYISDSQVLHKNYECLGCVSVSNSLPGDGDEEQNVQQRASDEHQRVSNKLKDAQTFFDTLVFGHYARFLGWQLIGESRLAESKDLVLFQEENPRVNN